MDAPAGLLSSSTSLSSSLGCYMQPPSPESERYSPLLPDPPVSFRTLVGCHFAFKILSKMKEGERLDATATRVFSKYEKPCWSLNPRQWGWLQYVWRWNNNQSDLGDLRVIKTLTQNALNCVNNPDLTEMAVGYSEKIVLLFKLKKSVQRTLQLSYPAYIRTEEVNAKIDELLKAINRCIARLEESNQAADVDLSERYINFFRNRDFSLFRGIGYRDRVLHSAALSTFSRVFPPAFVEEVYRQYRLYHAGLYRIQDFQALFIGLLAQMRPADLNKDMLNGVNVSEIDLIAYNREITTDGITTPLVRYLDVFNRDLLLLKAHQSLQDYSTGNAFINEMFRFAHIERCIFDVAEPFTRYPNCPFVNGTLFTSMENAQKKSYQMYPLKTDQHIYALGLVPYANEPSPTLRFIITESGAPKMAGSETLALVGQLVEKTLEKSLDRSISVEICVPATVSSQNPVLMHLLNSVKEQGAVISKINLFFWGPIALSDDVSLALQLCYRRLQSTQFTLRYFLFINQGFEVQAIPDLHFFYTRNGIGPNFYTSLFFFDRQRDSPSKPGTAKRYFSTLDESKRNNETFLTQILTNHPEDAQVTTYVEGRRKPVAKVQHFDEIARLLSPSPPPPDYKEKIVSNFNIAIKSFGAYLPAYVKGT